MDNKANKVTLSVCTYNILAHRYALQRTFEYCDKKYLHWKSHRRNLVLSELSKLNCDIILLQEVDRVHDIEHYLRGQNYFCVYYQRPNRKTDGCLIAWKTSKFELNSSVYISNYNDLCHDSDESDKLRFSKDNIGMILILECKHKSRTIVVANTHLYWNPNMEDVKLFQTASFLNSIQWVINKHNLSNYKIIIGGDFNSRPNSTVYKLITNGYTSNISNACYYHNDHINDNESKSETETKTSENESSGKTLRIICDRDLRKTAQWLALMQIDCAYFAEQSTRNYLKLFGIARNEKRIIVTRNTRITSRNDCPKFLLIGARETQRGAYQHVMHYFGITIKLHRDTMRECLSCSKCLKSLKQTTLKRIKHLLPSNNDNLQNGKSCSGIPLEFYQCINTACGHLVYHREGWLNRLHHKRQQHYNSTKDLHKQTTKTCTKQQVNNNDKAADDQQLIEVIYNDKYKAQGVILKNHIYRKRRPVIIGVQIIDGSFKKYDRIFAVYNGDSVDLGMISEIQDNGKEIERARKGSKVCIRIESTHCFGRQFDDRYTLVIKLINNMKSTPSIPIQMIPIQDDKLQTYPSLKSNQLKHALKLKSVYATKYGKEPQTTNHTKAFSGCLDYLFVSTDCCIADCDKLPVPQKDLCDYLPDKCHPSDHLPVKGVLQL